MNRFMGYTSQLRSANKAQPIIREVVKGPDIEKIRAFQAKSQKLQAEMQKADNLGRAQVYMNNSITPNIKMKLAPNNVYTQAANNLLRIREAGGDSIEKVRNPIAELKAQQIKEATQKLRENPEKYASSGNFFCRTV